MNPYVTFPQSDCLPADLRVLVVDDDRHTRAILRGLLVNLGVRCILEAADGMEAFREAASFHPDVILADWEMPRMSGLRLLRMVREHAASPNPFVPFIMITARNRSVHVAQARDAGVDLFITKPITRKAVQQRLEAAMHRLVPFILCRSFCGPDRRRAAEPDQATSRRRTAPALDLDEGGDAFLIAPDRFRTRGGAVSHTAVFALAERMRRRRTALFAGDVASLSGIGGEILGAGGPGTGGETADRIAAATRQAQRLAQAIGFTQPLLFDLASSLTRIQPLVDARNQRHIDMVLLHLHTLQRLFDRLIDQDVPMARQVLRELRLAVDKVFPDGPREET